MFYTRLHKHLERSPHLCCIPCCSRWNHQLKLHSPGAVPAALHPFPDLCCHRPLLPGQFPGHQGVAHCGHYSDAASGRGESVGPHQTDLLLSAGKPFTCVLSECWVLFSGALVLRVIVISMMVPSQGIVSLDGFYYPDCSGHTENTEQ